MGLNVLFSTLAIGALSVTGFKIPHNDAFNIPHNDGYRLPTQEHLDAQRRVLEFLKSSSVRNGTDILEELRQSLMDPSGIFRFLSGDNPFNVSEPCLQQANYTRESLLNKDQWALKMLDSFGKVGPGALIGRFKWVGDFDECISIQSQWNSTLGSTSKIEFKAKYCMTYVPTKLGSSSITIQVGTCMPEACTNLDVYKLLYQYVGSKLGVLFYPDCHERQALIPSAIVAIVIYSVICAACVAGTVYDVASRILHKSHANTPIQMDLIARHEETHPTKTEHGKLGTLLLCFSFYSNGVKILSGKKTPGSLGCLHGIRFISMTWVILGHTIAIFNNTVDNLLTPLNWVKDRISIEVILNATVSVDSFFVMSGMLSMYLVLKQLEKSNPGFLKFLVSVPIIYLHRWIRLTPAYGLMILFYSSLAYYLYDGPFQPTTPVFDKSCSNNSWASLLYYNNFYPESEQCAAWGWYLANDFQFSLVVPWLAYLLLKWEKVGVLVSSILVVHSMEWTVGLSLWADFGFAVLSPVRDPAHPPAHTSNAFNTLYDKPWTRYQSFGIGVIYGWILWRTGRKLNKMPWWLNLFLWGVAGASMCAYLYGPYDVNRGVHIPSMFEAALYNGVGRAVWSLCLGYVMLACCCGRGGIVDEFLSWSGFLPLSRLTYCAYLLHPVVIIIIRYSSRDPIYLTDFVLITQFLQFVVLAYALAFVWSLLFESTFMNLDKTYLTGLLQAKRNERRSLH